MRFLVRITTALPPEWPDEHRDAVLAAESARGRELVAGGVIEHLWRVPGNVANVGIWAGPDADALHSALISLPAAPWQTVSVEALATHPLFQ